MLTDVRMGRSVEVEAILGNTVRIARKLRVEAKYLEMLYVLTKGLDYAMHPDEKWRPIA
jgi:2-dehydropantoate 2-reductase